MTNSKYFYLTLAAVVLLIFGGVGYYVSKYQTNQATPANTSNMVNQAISTSPQTDQTTTSPTPTPDSTADWQTYENKDGQLSFQYPKGYT